MKKLGGYLLFLSFFIIILSIGFSNAIEYNNNPLYQYLQNPFFKSSGMDKFDISKYTGAATYQYNIQVPIGTNGLQPKLEIFYNSHFANKNPGDLGSGWSITENYIERNVNYTVDNSKDDKFNLYLNGNSHELIYVNSENKFHTKIESFLKIENLSGGINQNGTYWMVKDKEGTNYRFGYFNYSELISEKGYASRWSLDKVNDTYNNSIFYNYIENIDSYDRGAVYFKNITYNNGQNKSVIFEYESTARSDVWISKNNGIEATKYRRLKDIVIKIDSNLVKRYHFNYSNLVDSSSLSFLSSIIEFGSDNSSSLPPMSFDYNFLNKGYNGVFADSPGCFVDGSGISNGYRILDVNGDGMDDIIYGTGTNEYSEESCGKQVIVSNGTQWVPSTYQLPGCIVGSTGIDFGYRFVDLNGDGMVDIIKGRGQYATSCGSGSYDTWLNDGTNWVGTTDDWGTYCFVGSTGQDFGYRFVDLNGD